ncbi:hypothetical protein V5O48_013007 [Marasmius crinis-equi]|uniref:Uncharacterized protein n=1 Tax=Marasmius crinis-equi TaxID=585013 RepID=A0ABR3F1L0_9AGAR
MRMTPGIGKLHEPGHQQIDHKEYSLNLIKGAAQVDGESNKRIWGPHNILGNSMKTMGPGARQDLLEAQFDFWNWQKYQSMGRWSLSHEEFVGANTVILGKTLFCRWRSAVEDLRKLLTAHDGLSENLPPKLVGDWEKMLNVWKDLPFPKATKELRDANPFKVREQFLSQDKALQELEAEDEAKKRKGKISYHSMSAAAFVAASFEVIHAQEKLKKKIEEQKREPTLKQSNKLMEEQRAIKRRIHALSEVKAIYMPGLASYIWRHEQGDDMEEVPAEDIVVWLPSRLIHSEVDLVCVSELVTVESKLQFARANDALDGVRHTLRVKACMLLFKNANTRGQRDSGRAQAVINRIMSRVKRFAEQYRNARVAYYAVVKEGAELGDLPVLAQSDIQALTDPARVKRGPGRRGTQEDDLEYEVKEEALPEQEEELDLIPADTTDYDYRTKHGTGETRKVNSWIWGVSGQGLNEISLEDGADKDNELVRAEWCRSRARVKRAREEIALLKEEMRRTTTYLTWAGERWEVLMKEAKKQEADGGLREGRKAYAKEQAELQYCLRDAFSSMWRRALEAHDDLEATKDDGWDERKAVKEEEEARRLDDGGSDGEEDLDDEDM